VSDRMFIEREATKYMRDRGLPVTDRYLRDQRRQGKGPPFRYFHHHVVIEQGALDTWIEQVLGETWTRPRKRKRRKRARPAAPAEQSPITAE
jgi:hypothetical protein